MSKNEILLQLALNRLTSLYQSEHLVQDFLKVLHHRASSEDLKWQILGRMHLIRERSKHLRSMLAYFETNIKKASNADIRGILQYGLKLIQQSEDETHKDMVLIHVLQLLCQHEWEIYHMVAAYLDKCGLEMESRIMQKFVLEEEYAIVALNNMIFHHAEEAATS